MKSYSDYPFSEWVFRTVLVQVKCLGKIRMEVQRRATQSYSISPRIYRTVLVQRIAGLCIAGQITAKLFDMGSSYIEPFWFTAEQGIAWHRIEALCAAKLFGKGGILYRTVLVQRSAMQFIDVQRNAVQGSATIFGKVSTLPNLIVRFTQPVSTDCFIKGTQMAIQQANIKINGISYLLQNNPQTVDPFNRFSKAMKVITKKKTGKTEDDLIELGNIETESKIYFDEVLGVYVPTRWLTEAICTGAFAVIKTGKDKMRGGIFAVDDKAKLTYKEMNKVKTITDVVMNPVFRHRALLPQGQVRIPKDFPIFKDWSFETAIEFDDTVVDFNGLKQVVERTAKYVGFGDFRPTFGRATAEVTNA